MKLKLVVGQQIDLLISDVLALKLKADSKIIIKNMKDKKVVQKKMKIRIHQ